MWTNTSTHEIIYIQLHCSNYRMHPLRLDRTIGARDYIYYCHCIASDASTMTFFLSHETRLFEHSQTCLIRCSTMANTTASWRYYYTISEEHYGFEVYNSPTDYSSRQKQSPRIWRFLCWQIRHRFKMLPKFHVYVRLVSLDTH